MVENKVNEENFKPDYDDLSDILSDIVNSLPVFLFVKDTGYDLRYVFSSPMMDNLYTNHKGDVVGRTDFDLFGNQEEARLYRVKDMEIVKTGKSQRFFEESTDDSGHIHIMDTMKRLIARKGGKPPYLMGISWDVTEQKEFERNLIATNRRFMLACKAAKVISWTWDYKTGYGEFIHFVKDQVKIDRFKREDYIAFIHPNDRPLLIERMNAFIKGEVPILKCNFRTTFYTDEYVWYEDIGEVYEWDENGKPLKSVGLLRDLTAEIRHEEDVRAVHVAEESNRMKSTFLSNMSHEIRTPLNAITGFANLLKDAESDDERQEYIQIIQKNCTFLSQLVNDILDVSKIESGKMDFVFTSFHLNDLFAPHERVFQMKAEKGVKVIYEHGGNDYLIVSEFTRLNQVIINFLSNAVKFTQSGSIRYGYKLTYSGLYVYVTDTGIGIEEKSRAAIFERFVKLDSFKQGTGLGLSICKMIVTKLKGEIGVKSELGKGSTFWFTFPCTPVKIPEEEKPN